MRSSFVYILATMKRGTLYIGVTADLIKRVYQHKNDLVPGFSKRHQVHRLVYYKQFLDIGLAIQREKQLKKWNRAWIIRLIEEQNPNWEDLFHDLF